MAMHTELWFPSVVWSSIIHVGKNEDLKAYAYELKKDVPTQVLSNYGGYQSPNLKAGESKALDRLMDTITKEVNFCANQVGLKPLELYNVWININPPGAYNDLHNHAGSVLSGVYYIEADSSQGNIQFERSDNADYHMPLDVDKHTYFTSTRASYASKTNALYVFPSWLKHSVQGNTSRRDRLSISFNYGEVK
jgi:uncharacterized protein (TIGR02466 family)